MYIEDRHATVILRARLPRGRAFRISPYYSKADRMRPSKIRKAASELKKIIKNSGAAHALNGAADEDAPPPKRELLEASTYLSKEMGKANPDVTRLAEKTGTMELSTAEYWKPLLGEQHVTAIDAHGRLAKLEAKLGLLEALSSLLGAREPNLKFGSKDTLTLVFPETDDQGRSLAQVQDSLNAVETLYSIHQDVENLENDNPNEVPLTIATAETGSELAFILLGAAPTIAALGALIITVWDRIHFAPERKLSEQMDSISDSVELMEEISNKEDQIGQRRAEKMKSDIATSVRDLLDAGAISEENQDMHKETAKRLATEETRALPEETETTDTEED